MKKNMTLFAGIFMILAIVCVSFGCDQASNDSATDLIGTWGFSATEEIEGGTETFSFTAEITSDGWTLTYVVSTDTDTDTQSNSGTYSIDGSTIIFADSEGFAFTGNLSGSTLVLTLGGTPYSLIKK